jgi:FAD/FMN-containing dehydrogenase
VVSPDLHAAKVERIAGALARHPRRLPVSLRKRATSHQVPKAHDAKYSDALIDVSDLGEVLAIDEARRVCVAESGVTFVDLLAATLPRGLVPLVVPELETITIGGAVAGCSLESSSFAVGGFHDTCLEYEVVTAQGDVLTCRPDNENALLFQMMHGTFGTLGVLSKLTFRLGPAKPFVRIAYERHRSLAAFEQAVSRHAEARDVDFIDGMFHAPDDHVLCAGRFVDEAPYVSRYDWLKVYCQSTRSRAEDFLRTRDYFFRYDRGVTNVHPSSFLGRLLLGKVVGSSEVLRLAEHLHRFLPAARPTVTLDVFVPLSRAAAFLSWYQRTIGHYPLWCVPYARVRDYEWLSPAFYSGLSDQLFLDIAIYGCKQARGGPNLYRLIEEKLLEMGGMKTLISHNYFTEDEFWRVWNKDNYATAKSIADPQDIFRDLYTKTCRAAQGRTG